jgi:hypothetical protein
MSGKRYLLGCLVLAAAAGSLRADPLLPLDLIPEDACIGIGVRDLAELRAKSDRLVGKRQPGDPGLFLRPSELLAEAYKKLNLPWKIDEKKAGAIVCLSGALGGYDPKSDPKDNFSIGAVVAAQSLEEVARGYKLEVADLKKGGVHQVPGKKWDHFFGTDQAGFRDPFVFLTGNEKATAAWMKARTLRQARAAAEQRRLDAADGLIYLGPPLLAIARKEANPDTLPNVFSGPEKEAQQRLYRASLEAQNVLVAYRLDDGLGLGVGVGFDPQGVNSQAVLKAFSGPGRTSDLAGLPDSERLVGAFAAIGLERPDLHLARVLAGDLWQMMRAPSGILESDAPVVRRLFGDLYSRLRLGRAALYFSSDRARFGQLAAVLVLEPTDAEKFLAEVRQYARLGDVAQFDPRGQAGKAEIEKLIADLGADDFEVREAATTKLGLIGSDALPYLEKAAGSDDAEVRRRAEDLLRGIRQAAELRKKELAEGLLKKAFRPTFTFQPDAEKVADASVHLLGMRFEGPDAPYAAALKDLFGPEWGRIRLAVVQKKVVVLIGSELALLEQALRNVRDGKAGLEQSAALAAFHKQAGPGKRLELHLALGRVRALVTPADRLPMDFKPTGACTSLAIRSGAAELGLDGWVPAEAVPDVREWFGIR